MQTPTARTVVPLDRNRYRYVNVSLIDAPVGEVSCWAPPSARGGGRGLWDWPVARQRACSHSRRSCSSSQENTTWSPSFTALKYTRPPCRPAGGSRETRSEEASKMSGGLCGCVSIHSLHPSKCASFINQLDSRVFTVFTGCFTVSLLCEQCT